MKILTARIVLGLCLSASLIMWPICAYAGLWGDFVSTITGSDDAGDAVDGTIDASNEALSEVGENAQDKLEQTADMMEDVSGQANDMRQDVIDNMGGGSPEGEVQKEHEDAVKRKEAQKKKMGKKVSDKAGTQEERRSYNAAMMNSRLTNSKSSSSGKERTNFNKERTSFNKSPKKASNKTDAIRTPRAPSMSGKAKTGGLPRRDTRTIGTKRK